MSLLLVIVGFPLILAGLGTGVGLLVERVSGIRLPALLLPVVGFAGLILVSQLVVLVVPLAPLVPWFLLAFALAGLWLGRRELRRRWRNRSGAVLVPFLGAVAAYAVLTAPVWASGHLTFPGYLLDTNAGFHLAGGEYILHHGQYFHSDAPAYNRILVSYFHDAEPTGGQVLLAAAGWFTGQDLVWMYEPMQAFDMALVALVVAFAISRLGLRPIASAVAGLISAIPALVYFYALMGSIKEFSGLPGIFGMGALVLIAPRLTAAGWRGLVVYAVMGAGAIGALGPSSAPWLIGFAAIMLIFGIASSLQREPGRVREMVGAGAWRFIRLGVPLALATAVLALPSVIRLGHELTTALQYTGSSAGSASAGNLLRPLYFVQAFGVWLGYDHRVDPRYLTETYVLIGVVMLAAALGIAALIRRRDWALLSLFAWLAIVYVALVADGSEWTDAKVLMMLSPAVLALAMIGVLDFIAAARKIEGVVLLVAVAGGVFASDAMAYHGTNLAPVARFEELEKIDNRFGGDGPTLVTDFDEYAVYMLRHLDIDEPGLAAGYRRNFTLAAGGGPAYTESYDIDAIAQKWVQQFRLIVTRLSPRWSRPPGNFKLVFAGHFYDVWKRTAPAPLVHIPVSGGIQQPVGSVACTVVHHLASEASASHESLRYATRLPNVIANLATASYTSGAVFTRDLEGLPQFDIEEPSVITTSVRVPATAKYQIWLGGQTDRALAVAIDGRNIGSVSYQSAGDGNMMFVARIAVRAGRHTITITYGGGSLKPANAGPSDIDGVYLTRGLAENEKVQTLAPSAWRSLCGRQLDWLEVG